MDGLSPVVRKCDSADETARPSRMFGAKQGFPCEMQRVRGHMLPKVHVPVPRRDTTLYLKAWVAVLLGPSGTLLRMLAVLMSASTLRYQLLICAHFGLGGAKL